MTKRPIGISILTVLHFIRGGILMNMPMRLLNRLDLVAEDLNTLGVGIPPILVVIGFILLAGVLLASAMGMWRGLREGWWLAAFFYTYAVAINTNGLLMTLNFGEELEGVSRGTDYAKFGINIVVHFLIVLYLFKPNVIRYFGIHGTNKRKAVSILVAIFVVLFGVFSAMTWLAG